jgi:hypothetical protein
MVTIPLVAVDPAGLRAAADQLRTGGDALADQAGVLVRTWTGLGEVYLAPEAPALVRGLDPVGESAQLHRARLAAVSTALDVFSYQAESVIRQLDDLRAQAAGADPFAAADIEARAGVLMSQLEDAERTCAAAVTAETDRYDDTPAGPSSEASWLALLAGDKIPGLGAGYLDTDLEFAMLTHFSDGSGTEYVLSPADLAQLRDDPAVRQGGDAIRAGQLAAATPVTLEGGIPGYRVDVDFKQPVPGRPVNPFDGSIGRGHVFYDRQGNFAGISDAFDFTNGGNAVDLVNLDAALFGSAPFHDRGGVIEERPADPEIPVRPDALTAAWRLVRRNVLGEDPGDYDGPRPELTTGRPS